MPPPTMRTSNKIAFRSLPGSGRWFTIGRENPATGLAARHPLEILHVHQELDQGPHLFLVFSRRIDAVLAFSIPEEVGHAGPRHEVLGLREPLENPGRPKPLCRQAQIGAPLEL